MNLNFIKSHDRWVAEFKVTSDFNLHIEGVVEGNVSVFHKTIENGNYAFLRGSTPSPSSFSKVYDLDFSALVYPKYIRVTCATEPTLAIVTIAKEGGSEEPDVPDVPDVPSEPEQPEEPEEPSEPEPLPLGVFIQHVDGKLYTEDEWTAKGFSNDEANGVAVSAEECAFVIAKDNISKAIYWSSAYSSAVDGLALITETTEAKNDYNGNANTQLMLAIGASGAGYTCANYVFPNGKKSYLPAAGEWNVAYANKSAIDAAMTLIGGATLLPYVYWSSTQYDNSKAWHVSLNNGSTSYAYKPESFYVRAFTTL